ncbi:MAG: Flp family type IVb pilin [Novosphingobium sp.]
MKAKNIIYRILQDESGATAVEYGLLAGLVVMASLVGMDGFASQVELMWHNISSAVAKVP